MFWPQAAAHVSISQQSDIGPYLNVPMDNNSYFRATLLGTFQMRLLMFSGGLLRCGLLHILDITFCER